MARKQETKIHVVHIIPRLGFGGAERFVVELARHIPSAQVKQTVVTLWDDQPLARELPASVRCVSLDFSTLSRSKRIGTLVELLHNLGATVVHTHLFSADVWGRLAARKAGLPVVTTEHNINKDEPKLWEYLKRSMKNYSRVYTAPSEAVAQFMKRAYHVKDSQIQVIPHGIDLKKFRHIPSATFGTPVQVTLVGRLVPQKGHRVALDAFKKLSDVNCKLVIVGSGILEKELKHYADKIGVGKRVEWRGATHDMSTLYRESDIILVPSLWEGLGLVVLEAMASERLVIASRVDGIVESIDHEQTGVLFEKGNSSELAQALRVYSEDTIKSLQIAKAARAWAVDHADVVTMAKQYQAVYQNI